MPTTQGIIDSIATPPIASLQQVLDTNGPYGPGSHTLTQFTTGGAFLLPAGTYPVSGTYGVLLVVNGAIAPRLGFTLGWIGPGGTLTEDASLFHDRICQLVVQHQLPITGAWVTTSEHEMFELAMLTLWQGLVDAPARIGLYVAPTFSVDAFFMCVL